MLLLPIVIERVCLNYARAQNYEENPVMSRGAQRTIDIVDDVTSSAAVKPFLDLCTDSLQLPILPSLRSMVF